jgi:transaldolase
MRKLRELHDRFGQSPWLDARGPDCLTRSSLESWLGRGVRGVTSSAAVMSHAIEGSADQVNEVASPDDGGSMESLYWSFLAAQLASPLGVLRSVYKQSDASDGFLSVGLPFRLADDIDTTVAGVNQLYQRTAKSNLIVEIPATSRGIPVARQLISEGRSVNMTLIASLARYEQVIDAYLSGLETQLGDLSRCRSFASFSLSAVDWEVDRRLAAIGSPSALGLRGKVAVAQAKVAYRLFEERFFGARWQALVTRGAKVQRPLWSWTTVVDNALYPDLRYAENLVGPNTVSALSETTIAALEDHGTLARTVDQGLDDAEAVLHRLGPWRLEMSRP